jgi:lysophospholipase L1-like esterase
MSVLATNMSGWKKVKSKSRNLTGLSRFFLVIIGILLAILIVEIILRFFPEYSFESMVSERVFHGSGHDFHVKYFRPSELFGNELIPNADETINSFGMRDREYSESKPEGVYRIMILGDSITQFGEWADYLEEKLQNDGNYEVLNAAVAGWNLQNYYLYLKNKGIRFEPDMVITALCLNDVRQWNRVETFFSDHSDGKTVFFYVRNPRKKMSQNFDDNILGLTLKINPMMFRKSHVYRFVAVNLMSGGRAKPDYDPGVLFDGMREIAGGEILAVVIPYLIPLNKYNYDQKFQFEYTVRWLDKSGIEYLDLTPNFNKYGAQITDFRIDKKDYIHYNTPGNRLISELVYGWLKEKLD